MFVSGKMYNTRTVEYLGHIAANILGKCQRRKYQHRFVVQFKVHRKYLLEIEPIEMDITDISFDAYISTRMHFMRLTQYNG